MIFFERLMSAKVKEKWNRGIELSIKLKLMA